MNIFRKANKSPVSSFFKNSACNLLLALIFLSWLFNFCNFVITFSLMQVTMICRRVKYFRWSEIIEYYGKKCSWNSMSMKTKNYVRNYTRYTTLKSHFLWFTLGYTTVVSSTERYQIIYCFSWLNRLVLCHFIMSRMYIRKTSWEQD